MMILWIPLKAKHLHNFRSPSSEPYKYVFSYTVNERIIESWCLYIFNIQFNVLS